MVDFPTSLVDFQRRFPDEAACAAWLFEARWPTGFRCPACDHDKAWPHGERLSPTNAPPAAGKPPSRRGRSCTARSFL